MLHMVIVSHTPDACPAREENAMVRPCLRTLDDMLRAREITIVGRWADPPAHVNYLVLDAPHAHAIQESLMESGLFQHTTTEIRPVLSMD